MRGDPATALGPADRAALASLARDAALHRLGAGPPAHLPREGALAAPGAAAVELLVDGALRASLAVTTAEGPLGETVARLAARAVDGDPRFPALAAADAPRLAARVTVLGPPRRLGPGEAVRAGAEAVLVRRGWHRGLLLPAAARAAGWDPTTCLVQACVRAGLPARAHEDPDAVVEAFPALELDPA